MFRFCFLIFTFISFSALALPLGGYWKPGFRQSICLMEQQTDVKISSELKLHVLAIFSYMGKGYKLSEQQKIHDFKKGSHVLSFYIIRAIDNTVNKVDYSLDVYVDGEKLNKSESADGQYFFVTGQKVATVLERASRSHAFNVELKSASGEVYPVEFNNEQLSLGTKMYFTCSKNIT